ncbi:hypothetical protein ACLJJ6_04365 [Pediococcus siamensis]|uniref:hypothetical protein n=1 Tax=Pediococcus siamensis TaxID=381829 RepID=UPI0039A3E912
MNFPVIFCQIYYYNNFDDVDFKLTTTVFRDLIRDIFGKGFGFEKDGSFNHHHKLNVMFCEKSYYGAGEIAILTFGEYAGIIKLDDFTEFIGRCMNPREPSAAKRKKMLDEIMLLQNSRYNNSSGYQNKKETVFHRW